MNIGGVARGTLFLFTDSSDTEAQKKSSDLTAAYLVSSKAISHVLVFLLYLDPFGNVISSLHASFYPSPLSLFPRSPFVLLCEVTCERDQLNPDHQLCLTYFRFGTLGFLAFTFVYVGLA